MLCRYCNKPLHTEKEHQLFDLGEAVTVPTFSYWSAVKFHCHKECKKAGESLEAYECQSIDANCNDCLHLERLTNYNNVKGSGWCKKLNKPCQAWVNFATGNPCFEHRKHAVLFND